MSTIEDTAGVVVPRVEEPSGPPRRLGENWWRHVVGILAALYALFPVAYVVSAAFNADSSLSGASLIPREVTFDNFKTLFASGEATKHIASAADYPWWYLNTLIVAAATAFLTVLLGALGAYAFSRFRFKGRRMGMMFLLLIQMFPQVLLVVAIYLIVFNLGDVFHVIGLNTLTGLILVHLGGVMGVNTWLMKGFFDTIPSELDESARVDGATPAQVYWAGAPTRRADSGRRGVAHVHLHDQRIRHPERPAADIEAPDAAGGYVQFRQRAVRTELGPVLRRRHPRRDSRSHPVPLAAEVHHRRSHAGVSEGMTVTELDIAAALDEPYHDGSDACVLERPAKLGDRAVVQLRVPRASSADSVALRYVDDGEPRIVQAVSDGEPDGETLWRATFRPPNPRPAIGGCSPAARSAGRG